MKTRKKLNYRFLACMFVVVVAFGVSVHFVHGYQVKRNAVVLLHQADQAKEEKDSAQELQYLGQYLGFVPDDIEARARFGNTLYERAKEKKSLRGLREAFFQHDMVLRRDPQQKEVRKRQVEIAMDLGRYADALAHIKVLLLDNPKDTELQQKMGLCYHGIGQFNEAVLAYEKAIQEVPEQLDNYVRAAVLAHERLDNVRKADELVDKMIEANPKAFKAYLRRSQYLLQYHAQSPTDIAKAGKDVDKAIELAPDEPEVVLAAARVEQAKGKPDKAREVLLKGIQAHPSDPRPYLDLIVLEAREDKAKEALAVVRQGLKVVPEKDEKYGDLLHAEADLLVQNGELKEAEEAIARLRKMNYSQALLDYLQARIHAGKNEWSKASALLDEILPKLGRIPGLEMQALLLLGQCRERLGNPDEALQSYQRARKLDPLSAAAHYRIGNLLMSLGRSEEAVAEFRQVLTSAKKPDGLHALMVRALISRNLRLPRKERDLNAIRREIAAVAKETPDSIELPVWQAELMLLDDPKHLDTARRLINKTRDAHPDEVGLWIASSQLAGREEALGILARAADRPKLAGRVELLLARLGYLMQSPIEAKTPEQQKKIAEDKRASVVQMEKEAAKVAEADRPRLLSALADAHLRLGDTAAAERLWQQVAKQQPKDLGVRLLLFDLALIAKSAPGMDRLLAEIRGIEGENGAYWRYAEASRRLQQARPKDKEELSASGRQELREARQRLIEAAQHRPNWSRIPALEGEIDELEGNVSAAIDKYQQALALGERRPAIVRKTVTLLFDQRRFDEANSVVRKLRGQENTLLAAGLGKLAAANMLANPDSANPNPDLALEMAQKSVSPDSKAYQDHLWLGRVQLVSKKLDEAEKSFKRACELGADAPETWVTLVAFLAGAGKKKEAEQAIAQAEKKLPPKQAALALAACYESIGDLQKADEHYQAALKAAPEDLRTLRSVVGFHLRRNESAKAETRLRGILAMDSSKVSSAETLWARRALAAVLVSRSDRRHFDEALALVEKNLTANKDSKEDQHLHALLLATRYSRRKEAIRLLENLNQRGELNANERFTLARLYLIEDNWTQAERHMLVLLDSPEGKEPGYEAFYARRLLQRDNIAAAQAQLEKLEKTLPDAPLTREIRARVFQAQGKDAEAVDVVRQYAQSKDADLVKAGLLLESLANANHKTSQTAKKLYLDQAEALYRKHMVQSDKPERFLAMAEFQARKRDFSEALSYCNDALKHKAPMETVASVLTGSLRESNPGIESCRRVEQILKNMLSQRPDSVTLLICLADVYDMEGRFADAEAVYRGAMRKDANHAMLLNNLAWLLAFQKPQSQQEALALVNRAIDLIGPSPELLDTRGIVHLMLNRGDEAVEDLRLACSHKPSANHSFHLARALAATNKINEARQAMEDANKFGFEVKALHPLEKSAGQRLAAVLQAN